MKKYLLIGMIGFSGLIGRGQNLIQNGSFEQYTSCPTSHSQIDSALFWMNPSTGTTLTGSPDYYNQCAPNANYSVPSNSYTYQIAHNGFAYAGGYMTMLAMLSDVREYLEAP